MKRRTPVALLFLTVVVDLACGRGEDRSGPPPSLAVEPAAISFSKAVADADPPPQELTIINKGGQSLTWSVTTSEKWLTAVRDGSGGQSNGVEGPGGRSKPPLLVLVSAADLRPGIHHATISVSSGGGSATIPVSFTIIGGPARLRVEPTSFSFAGFQRGSNPAAQALTVFNDGGRHMPWSASADQKWLTVTRSIGATGVEGPDAKSTPPLDVAVNLEGLAPGTYKGKITVIANGGGTATIPVSLKVTAGSARD